MSQEDSNAPKPSPQSPESSTTFEQSLDRRLTQIETHAKYYLTAWHVVAGSVVVLGLAAGYGAWMFSQLDKKLEDTTAQLKEHIDFAVSKAVANMETSFTTEIRAASGGFYYPPGLAAFDLLPVQSGSGKVIGLAKGDDGELQSIINQAVMDAVESGAVSMIGEGEIYIRENGDLKPWIWPE